MKTVASFHYFSEKCLVSYKVASLGVFLIGRSFLLTETLSSSYSIFISILQSNMVAIIQNGRPEMFQGAYPSRYSTDNDNFSAYIIFPMPRSSILILYSILEFNMAAKVQDGCHKVIQFYKVAMKLPV